LIFSISIGDLYGINSKMLINDSSFLCRGGVMKFAISIVLFTVVMLALAGCASETAQQVEVEQPVPSQETVQETVAEQQQTEEQPEEEPQLVDDTTAEASLESTVKEFEMVSKRFVFEPNVLNVNLNDRVILHITSADVGHGIAIPAFGVSEQLPPGKTVAVEFIADQKGEFDFYCNVPCGSGHRDMRAKLIVS
jgi:heme/copper-type cytochrome/quinol oxidase subunit 2